MSSRAPETIATPGEAFWNQREILREHIDRLRALQEAVAWPGDLFISQWAQLFTFTTEFRPDLIVELGRGMGNSTCVFTEAASVIGDCRVQSLCLSRDWEDKTEPRVRQIADEEWFSRLTTHRGDIMDFDFEDILGTSERVLLFWDAHGFDIAEFVLGSVLPLIEGRSHIVAMHDLSDARYVDDSSRGYKGQRLWRGNDWSGPRVQIGHVDSAVEQSIAALDFTTRNRLTLASADESLHALLDDDERRRTNLIEMLGDDIVSPQAHWFWFRMEAGRPMTFPSFHRPDTTKRARGLSRLRLAVKLALDPAVRMGRTRSGEIQLTLPSRSLLELLKGVLRKAKRLLKEVASRRA